MNDVIFWESIRQDIPGTGLTNACWNGMIKKAQTHKNYDKPVHFKLFRYIIKHSPTRYISFQGAFRKHRSLDNCKQVSNVRMPA